jgi:zona occludens toxin
MITFITGGPGLGKTALAVSMLLDEYPGRPVFSNINELQLEHSPLPKLDEWTRQVVNDQGTVEDVFTFPVGSVVVIDECQKFYRPRASGSKVPPYVAAFETHRHEGIDFILITQGSRLVDGNIRSLIKGGRHIFLKSSYLGRYRYEKSECINEDDRASYGLAAKRKYTLPKKAFKLYKSSELHTKPPRPRLPLAAFVVVLAGAVGLGLTWRASARISEAITPENEVNTGAATVAGAERLTRAPVPVLAAVPLRIVEAMTPLDDHNPLSAPLYSEKLPQVTPPEIVGCIASSRACSCFSQQATPIWVPEPQCRDRAAGRYYDPYRHPTQPEQRTGGTTPRTAAGATARGTEALPAPAG